MCGVVKPSDDFNKSSKSSYGLQSECRLCQAARRKANRAELAEKDAKYCAEHKEQIAARKKTYEQATRDHIAARKRAYREAHQEEEAAYSKKYNIEHPEKVLAWSQRRRALKAGAAILGKVSYPEIIQRDRGLCWLCGKLVAKSDRSFDHAIPLHKGGEHSTRNIRLTHLKCNISKYIKDIEHQRYLL